MSNLTPIPREATPVVSPVGGLLPATLAEAIQLAELMAKAKLVPEALQQSPADCLLVIQQAMRWEFDPFACAQETYSIKGRLMFSGKLIAAVINARGNLAERLNYAYEGSGADRSITVTGRLTGEAMPRSVSVRAKDALTSNDVWKKQPDQQLAYHATRVWARRHMPELMLGVYAPEEFDRDENPPAPAPAPSPIQPQTVAAPHDPATGELGPHAIAVDADNWIAWGSAFVAALDAAATIDELAAWGRANAETLQALRQAMPKVAKRVEANILRRRAELRPADAPAASPPADPEAMLAAISDTLAACGDREILNEVWHTDIEPRLNDMFPPDAAIARAEYARHLERLA